MDPSANGLASVFNITVGPTQTLPPVGKCIYCGNADDLRREHIVPYGLGGNLVLPQASCKVCEAITCRIEGFCLREMFGPFRHAAGMQTRRKKERPKDYPVEVTMPDGQAQSLRVSAQDMPPHLHFLEFPPARILRGLPDAEKVEGANVVSWLMRDRLRAMATRLGYRGGKFALSLGNGGTFARMIAKIGHGWAVAKLGVDGFQHLATDFILNDSAGMNYLVGSQLTFQGIEEKSDNLYQLSMVTHASGMVVAGVRLLPGFGGPIYHVLVGLLEGGEIVPTFENWQKA